MKMNVLLRLKVCLVCCLGIMAGMLFNMRSFADEIAYSSSSSSPLTVNQFDPNLGNLNSIRWEYFDVISVSYSGQNTSSSFLSFDLTARNFFYIGLHPLVSVFQFSTYPITTHLNFSPGEIKENISLGAHTFQQLPLEVPTRDFTSFIGTGQFSFVKSYDVGPEFSPRSAEASMNDRFDIQSSPFITVTYSYSPVPEPTSFVLLTLATVGVTAPCVLKRLGVRKQHRLDTSTK